MKKMINILIALTLVAAMLAIPVLAAGNPSISVSSASGMVGDTVTVNVSISGNPGIVSGRVTLTYDKTALELVELKNVKFQGFSFAETGKANHSSPVPMEGDGVLCSAKFKILTAGSHSVAATVESMRDGSNQLLSVSSATGSVTGNKPACNHTMGQ